MVQRKGETYGQGRWGRGGGGGMGGVQCLYQNSTLPEKLIKMTAMAIMCSPINCLGMYYSVGILKVKVFLQH